MVECHRCSLYLETFTGDTRVFCKRCQYLEDLEDRIRRLDPLEEENEKLAVEVGDLNDIIAHLRTNLDTEREKREVSIANVANQERDLILAFLIRFPGQSDLDKRIRPGFKDYSKAHLFKALIERIRRNEHRAKRGL